MTQTDVDVVLIRTAVDNVFSDLEIPPVDHPAIADHYWSNRSADREECIAITTQWVVLAFLHYTHAPCVEIQASPQIDCLRPALLGSADAMIKSRFCKISMRPPCWRDVQKHHHDMARNDIHRIAELIHYQLLHEVISRMIARGTLYYEHGFWRLRSTIADQYIRQLKQKKMQWKFTQHRPAA